MLHQLQCCFTIDRSPAWSIGQTTAFLYKQPTNQPAQATTLENPILHVTYHARVYIVTRSFGTNWLHVV